MRPRPHPGSSSKPPCSLHTRERRWPPPMLSQYVANPLLHGTGSHSLLDAAPAEHDRHSKSSRAQLPTSCKQTLSGNDQVCVRLCSESGGIADLGRTSVWVTG